MLAPGAHPGPQSARTLVGQGQYAFLSQPRAIDLQEQLGAQFVDPQNIVHGDVRWLERSDLFRRQCQRVQKMQDGTVTALNEGVAFGKMARKFLPQGRWQDMP